MGRLSELYWPMASAASRYSRPLMQVGSRRSLPTTRPGVLVSTVAGEVTGTV